MKVHLGCQRESFSNTAGKPQLSIMASRRRRATTKNGPKTPCPPAKHEKNSQLSPLETNIFQVPPIVGDGRVPAMSIYQRNLQMLMIKVYKMVNGNVPPIKENLFMI